jgi:exopolyphosphatase/guanosine-5'-triphosphate,3'-diphosphate pyrophosphatase
LPLQTPTEAPRAAVVDLGSNSVRLVVFEGRQRNPVAIFNEKAVLRLGRGLEASGRLNAEGVAQALQVMQRYAAIAHAMGAAPFEVLATAAVRDAENGAEFVALLRERLPGVPIRVLAGAEEADFAAAGVLCGIPGAEGLLADIGGGSVELVRLESGRRAAQASLRLGVIRLAERSRNDAERARQVAEAELAAVPWLEGAAEGRDLYAVGGAWRALARMHIARTGYPLTMVHHYTIPRDEAREFATLVAQSNRRGLERLPGVPRRRMDDLPFAAVVLRRILRLSGARRVIFSANGLREGWYMQLLPPAARDADPLLAAAHDYAWRFGRDAALPPALIDWTEPLFPDEPAAFRRLREAACWMSDLGSHDHPEYRAEQAFLRALRQPGVGLDHHARAFLALALGLRYEAEPDAPFLAPARTLLAPADQRRAELLGHALRLAYTLSAGTAALLAATRLVVGRTLTLRMSEGGGVFEGESITRRLQRLAAMLEVPADTELVA